MSDSGQFKPIFINNVINYFKIKEQNVWVGEKSYLFCGEIFLFAIFVIIPYISGACVLRFVTVWYRVLDKSWKQQFQIHLLLWFLLDLVHSLKSIQVNSHRCTSGDMTRSVCYVQVHSCLSSVQDIFAPNMSWVLEMVECSKSSLWFPIHVCSRQS